MVNCIQNTSYNVNLGHMKENTDKNAVCLALYHCVKWVLVED